MTRAAPIVIVAVTLAVTAFLGQAGLPVAMAGLVVALAIYLLLRRRFDRMLLADYVERHSFPSDTVEEFAKSEAGELTLEQARQRQQAWRDGYVDAELRAKERRRAAARKAAETRRRRAAPQLHD